MEMLHQLRADCLQSVMRLNRRGSRSLLALEELIPVVRVTAILPHLRDSQADEQNRGDTAELGTAEKPFAACPLFPYISARGCRVICWHLKSNDTCTMTESVRPRR